MTATSPREDREHRQAKAARANGASLLNYEFQGLPLKTELGCSAAHVDGTAEIRIQGGEWFVGQIIVAGEPGDIELDRDADRWLYMTIWGRLQDGQFKQGIDAAVEAETQR